jgi:phosphotransferase system enzyme I (PtsI)
LGYRGIRVSLDQVEMFKTQLRAILKASPYGQLKIMFPMIAVLSEWKAAKLILEEVKEELKLNRIDFNLNLEIGMMIEVPSAALNAAQFAREVDFFSIGTNDLVQYLMAVDRGNAALSYLNNGYDPTVFRLIHHVIGSAHKYKKWVSLCGDMAGQPGAAAVFIGMGLQKLSMNMNELAHVRLKISQLAYTQMQKDTKHILKLNSAKEVIQYIEKNS